LSQKKGKIQYQLVDTVKLRIQTDFNKLRKEIKNIDPELKSELDEIQDSLDEVSADSEKKD